MKQVVRILLIATLCLCLGSAVAYYNTSSLGYDNANIISYNDSELRLFDIRIKYGDLLKKAKKARECLPEQFLTI